MKKEHKFDAYLILKSLKNSKVIGSPFSIHNLLNYEIEKEIITEEEAQTFYELFNIITAQSVEMKLYDEILGDD